MNIEKYMFRAISGALSILLIILVLRLALPEVADLVTGILVKLLSLLNNSLDLASNQLSE